MLPKMHYFEPCQKNIGLYRRICFLLRHTHFHLGDFHCLQKKRELECFSQSKKSTKMFFSMIGKSHQRNTAAVVDIPRERESLVSADEKIPEALKAFAQEGIDTLKRDKKIVENVFQRI